MNTIQASSADFFVRHIYVKKLFGHLDYKLDFSCDDQEDPSQLTLLYGDNGSGKTTLLKMLFHLLSPVDNKGHKSVIAQTKFSRFEVQLADGTTVVAERAQQRITGDLELRIEKGKKELARLLMKVGEDGAVRMSNNDTDGILVKKFLKVLSGLNVEILFMRDNRRLTSNLDPEQHANGSEEEFRGRDYLLEIPSELFRRGRIPERDTSLAQAVKNVTSFFRDRAMRASSKGEVDTNKIYDEIIRHIVLPGKRELEPNDSNFPNFMARFESLSERNQGFVKVGLVSPLLAKEMISSLKKAKVGVRPILIDVLKPYIDSVQARLDALDEIRHTIFQFTDSLNSFMGNGKKVSFSLGSGLQILGYDGEPLNPENLSSGEKQLLSMFCHIICTRGRTAIFIIDEPELSLNIKWQRRIVQSLLDCAAGSPVQFIMASHSMEVLAKHRKHVVQLNDKS